MALGAIAGHYGPDPRSRDIRDFTVGELLELEHRERVQFRERRMGRNLEKYFTRISREKRYLNFTAV